MKTKWWMGQMDNCKGDLVDVDRDAGYKMRLELERKRKAGKEKKLLALVKEEGNEIIQ